MALKRRPPRMAGSFPTTIPSKPPVVEICSAEGLWLRSMFEVGYNFGWRVSELLNMKVGQIDLSSRTIRLEAGETNNDEGREVEMTPLV